MEIAKSIILGGAIISAEDASYKSYIDLKLRCFYCGEPVFLKDGIYRVKHFSHFPNINSRTLF
jgi:competence CoiA-like predicted nuclease